MNSANKNSTSNLEPRTSQDSPEATKTPQCSAWKYSDPQSDEAGPEMPEEEVEQEEAPKAVVTKQCPNCDLLQLEEEPVPEVELNCACSKPVAVEHGIPVGPDQVLAQYNSRPPMLKTNPGRPVSAAPIPITNPGRPVSAAPAQINPNSGRPVFAAPIQIRSNPVQPIYVAPRPIGTCSRRLAYAAPIPNSPKPACPSCAAPKRR